MVEAFWKIVWPFLKKNPSYHRIQQLKSWAFIWQGIIYRQGEQPDLLGPEVRLSEVKFFEPQKHGNGLKVEHRNNFVLFQHKVLLVQDQHTVVVDTLSHVSFKEHVSTFKPSILASLLLLAECSSHIQGKKLQISAVSVVTCLQRCMGNWESNNSFTSKRDKLSWCADPFLCALMATN